MSFESWKTKYYPIPAEQLVRAAVPVADLIRHAITKWRGLSPAVLNRHRLKKAGSHIGYGPEGYLRISSESCTLCVAFYNCEGCPLVAVRGRRCDAANPDDMRTSPYHAWVLKDDPEPMLKLLQAALVQEEKKIPTPATV